MAESARTAAPARVALELGSRPAGMLVRGDGGDAFADVVVDVRADGARRKRLGPVQFSDICLEMAGNVDPDLLEWLRATLAGRFTAQDGALVMATYDGDVKRRLEFQHALVREVRFPALDAASKDAARLVVKLAPETTRRQPGSGSLGGAIGDRDGKSWLTGNFRLQIDGLDCSHVSRIDELVVKLVAAEDAVGALRQYEKAPVSLECSDLVVTLPEADAETFFEWHDRFVVRGQAEASTEKDGTLELLDPMLRTSRLTLELRGLGIHKLVSGTSSAGLRTVTASMYCQSIDIESLAPAEAPPVTAPPPDTAPPPVTDAPPPPSETTPPVTAPEIPPLGGRVIGGPVIGEVPNRLGRLPPPS